jgi:uncharacterized repeat protein (TIGR01451 family)
MRSTVKLCVFAAGLALAQMVLAQASAVSSQLIAQRVELVVGKPVFKPAGDGRPGDVLQYSTTYRNSGSAAASRLLATVPVPAGTSYIAASAEPGQAMASTDGISFAPMPLTRTVKQADGSVRKEPVPLNEYRALRWEIGVLPAGASTVVGLRVRIDTPVVAAVSVKP